jgi:hypothetical protein
MATPEPELPWYQFSLRSLLLLVFVVALICSLGACTHWVGPVVLATVVFVGGGMGRLIAGIRAGFREGTLYGTLVFLIVLSVSRPWTFDLSRDWRWVVGTAVLGGAVGGLTVRPPAK